MIYPKATMGNMFNIVKKSVAGRSFYENDIRQLKIYVRAIILPTIQAHLDCYSSCYYALIMKPPIFTQF
jgi:hypothetical protein